MATTAGYGSGGNNVSSTYNTSFANAYDTDTATYTTSTVAATTHQLEVTGYNFSSVVPAGATINSITVGCYCYGSVNNARWAAPTIRAYNGATALGTGEVTLTKRTSAGGETVSLTGTFTDTDVRASTFKIWFSHQCTSTTGSPTSNFGAAYVTVDYAIATVTPASVAGTATVGSVTIGLAVTPGAVAGSAAVSAPALPVTVLPAVVAGTGVVPQAGWPATVTPGVVAGSGTVPAPALPAVVAPTTVVGSGGVPAPALPATVTPAPLAGVGTVPTPTLPATATPDTVQGSGTVPAPTVSQPEGATATPDTVAGVGTVLAGEPFTRPYGRQHVVFTMT